MGAGAVLLHSLQDAHSQGHPLPAESPHLDRHSLLVVSKACHVLQFPVCCCREQLLQGRHPRVVAGTASGVLQPGKLHPQSLRCALILQAPLQRGKTCQPLCGPAVEDPRPIHVCAVRTHAASSNRAMVFTLRTAKQEKVVVAHCRTATTCSFWDAVLELSTAAA